MKLQEIRAAIEEYDAAVKEFDNLDNQDWEAIKHRHTVAKNRLVKWEKLARALLPIAEAAEALRTDITFDNENGKCLVCGTAGNKPHNYDCSVLQLLDALDALEG